MLRQYLLRTFINVNTKGILHNSTTAINKKGRPAINTAEELSKKPMLSVLDLKAETDTSIEIMENYERTDCGQQIKFYTLRIIHENPTEFPTQTSAEQSLKKVFERVRNS